MLKNISILLVILTLSTLSIAQLDQIKLKNALVIGLLDKSEDRYTVEINISELFASNGIKTLASLNVLKQGTHIKEIASDSVQQVLKSKGIDTYVLVSVRGFDRKFKPSTKFESLENELAAGHSFPLYREEISSITFEFHFYRNGQFVAYDILKVGGTSSREKVIKKSRKKIAKRLNKTWK
jgi:hypothetical protein